MRLAPRVLLYAFVVFLSSGLLLVLEMLAGRLIAPYVGVSLYTWTSVIGVVLAGLSLGNWIGGVWADRGAGEGFVGGVLLAAALASLAILLLLTLVAPMIQAREMSLLSASFLLVLALFFLPAALLGTVTPLLTTLALKLDSRTGHIVGMMHALAALGSIGGTFLTGYWLVQYFGTRSVTIATAIALALLALPFLWRRPLPVAAGLVLAAGLAIATQMRGGWLNPCDRESRYFCIRVVEETGFGAVGQARSLVLDHLIHGTNHATEPGLMLAPYVHLIDELVLRHHGGRTDLDFFFAGGGAYTQPRAAAALYPDARITVAELDPEVTETVRERLFVDTARMRIEHLDARVQLQREQGRFDVIVGDAFHDVAAPYHLLTVEFAELVRSRLSEDGIYLLNMLDAFPDARLVKSLARTLATRFAEVDVWVDEIPETPQRMTFVLSASARAIEAPVLESRRGPLRRWFRITEPLAATGTPMTELPVLSDDHVPVERLVSDLLLTGLGQ